MKKLTIIVSLLVACVGVSIAGIKSVGQFNAEMPNNAIQIDSSGNVDVAELIQIENNLAIQFEVLVDTTSVSPTDAGQLILGDDYNLYISTVSGGNWYNIGGK